MKHLKLFPLFCLSLAMCYSPIAKSQNSGPNAPEAMQFEPVDATDMVNLVTGDVSYVLPLLSIPSPEGDFPIAINYHAGIAMDQEASWVGLGWNLNVGAINRTVLGTPDDMNEGRTHTTFYDYLGDYEKNSTGCWVPIYMIMCGTEISWGDDWSFGGSVGLGNVYFGNSFGSHGYDNFVGIGSPNGMGVSASFGTSGVGVGVSFGNLNLSYNSNGYFNIGVSLVSFSVSNSSNGKSRSFGPIASVGISFSSEGTNATFNSVGFRTSNRLIASSQNVYTTSKEWNLDLYFVHFGQSTIKSFYFQKESKSEFGVLYFYNSMLQSDKEYHYGGVQTLDHLSDALIYPYNNVDYLDNDEVEKNSQLMMPAYDNYAVHAQGIGGNISPRFFKPGLIYGNGRTVKSREIDEEDNYADAIEEEIFYMNVLSDLPKLSDVTSNIYFYFNNLSESYLKIREGNFSNHSGDIIWGNTDFSGGQLESSTNYNANKYRKVNSNFVEYFTNKEIRDNKAGIFKRGFLETESINDGTQNPRSNASLFDPDGIGAFSIVSADGKTYHYSLPVYQFESFTSKDLPDEAFFDEISSGKYAYSWLLTAITGPDFVDRPDGSGNLGTVGNEDFGFWIKLDYGKWTDGYIWQIPYNKIGDNPYKWGRKQIYYLNAIKTKTHTVYFIKSLRNDGLGKRMIMPSNTVYERKDKHTKFYPEGITEFDPCTNTFCTFNIGAWQTNQYLTREINCNYEHQVLKLDKIVLVKNSDLELSTTNNLSLIANSPIGGHLINYSETKKIYNNVKETTFCLPPLVDANDFQIYYQNNVLDEKDNENVNVESKALRIIDLKYDYSLAKNSPNSSANISKGKLTLKSIVNKGANGVTIIPPYKFDYYYVNDYNSNLADIWGFNANYPQNWSLREITMPTGGKIKLEYESDSYHKETATNQQPYYIFNAFDKEPTKLEYDQTNGQKLKITIPIPTYIDKNTFFSNVTAYKLSADLPVDFLGMSPPDKSAIIKLRDITPINQSVIGNLITLEFYANHEYMNNIIYVSNFLKGSFSLKLRMSGEITAGGLRAKRIILNDGLSNKQITEYNYLSPLTNHTSGVTTYSPNTGIFVPYIHEHYTPCVFYEYVSVKTKTPDNAFDNETLYTFEVPASTSDPNNLAYSAGNQVVVQNDQLDIAETPFIPTYTVDNVYDITAHARSSLIKNNNAVIGRPLSIKTINSTGQVINETNYNYKPVSNDMPGSVQETFYYLKNFTKWGYSHSSSDVLFQYVSTSKVEYPSILDNMVSISNGLKTTTYYDSYDINTGRATSIRTIMPDGKEYKSVVVPAYTISSYAGGTTDDDSNIGMGSKVWNIYNKNMLSQEAASFNLFNTNTSALPIWKVIGTGIQTWNSNWNIIAGTGVENQTGVWRKHKTFAWK
ncbi:MAG: hypothetical protein JXB00_19630, partial [Bacteroidales bacterium]|nr:hypothetical protein [Bacteroidales bacterium]